MMAPARKRQMMLQIDEYCLVFSLNSMTTVFMYSLSLHLSMMVFLEWLIPGKIQSPSKQMCFLLFY